MMPSACRAEPRRVARCADIIEPSVVSPQRVARSGSRSVLAIKHGAAFHLVFEQRDVRVIEPGPFDENPVVAVVVDLVVYNGGIPRHALGWVNCCVGLGHDAIALESLDPVVFYKHILAVRIALVRAPESSAERNAVADGAVSLFQIIVTDLEGYISRTDVDRCVSVRAGGVGHLHRQNPLGAKVPAPVVFE